MLCSPCHTPFMPRQQGKSKRVLAWQPNRSRLEIRPLPAPAPSHISSPSSPTSSTQSGHSLNGLSPLSFPYACRIEWLDLLGNSLGFNPGPISNLASSSQPTLVIPPNSPTNSTHETSPVHSPPIQAPSEGFRASHGHQQEKPHSYSDYACCIKIQEGLAILQGLVF
jgi:hypothetical protein